MIIKTSENVNINRANDCQYVLAVVNGVVREVYEIDHWYYTENRRYNRRCEFTGKEATENIKKLFVNKRILSHYTKKG